MLIVGSVEAAELSFFFSFYRPVWFWTERWLAFVVFHFHSHEKES